MTGCATCRRWTLPRRICVRAITAHLRSRDIGTDRPGRSFESGTSAHHAVGQRHDLHTMEKQKFARLVAEQLDAASARGDFDELVLAAPPRALRELREALDAATVAKLVGTLEKDLVKTTNHELRLHLREWIGPSHGASR
jgi:protein required for attachment to host cells